MLTINFIQTLIGSALGDFSNLRKLYCYGCKKLEDDSVISLLRSANNLELLDIRYCEKISKCAVDVAVEVTKTRTNNIVLEFLIHGTNVDVDKIKGNSSFLHLSLWND